MSDPVIQLITSFNEEYRRIADITVPTMRRYADQYKLDFNVVPFESYGRAAAWTKIVAIKQVLEQGPDVVMWMDVDAMFVRMDVDIRTALTLDKDLLMVWHDYAGTEVLELGFVPHGNMGVLLVRNTPWSRTFMDQIWNAKPMPHGWEEQAAFHHIIGLYECLGTVDKPNRPNQELLSRIGWLDAAWNSIPGVIMAPDPIIHHYAGIAASARVPLLAHDQTLVAHRKGLGPGQRRALSRQMHVIAAVERRAARLALSSAEQLAGQLQAIDARLAEIRLFFDEGYLRETAQRAELEKQLTEHLQALEEKLVEVQTAQRAELGKRLTERLQVVEEELAEVHRSIPWRITARLRSLSRAARTLLRRLVREVPP